MQHLKLLISHVYFVVAGRMQEFLVLCYTEKCMYLSFV